MVERLTTEQADKNMIQELLKHVLHVGSYFFPFRNAPNWGKLTVEFQFQEGKITIFRIDNDHSHKV